MSKLKLYDISADGGETFSTQWLTDDEARELVTRYGYKVNKHCIPWDTHKIINKPDPIKRCPRCGTPLKPSDLPEYFYLCETCDENFYSIEIF